MPEIAIGLLAAVAGFIAALGLLVLWVGDRAASEVGADNLDPIIGARDQIAIYEPLSPYIPMPDHLKTRDEMVAWMTKELPKLTAYPLR